MILGGPPECPTFAGCEPGLESVYGLHFASFKSLDEAGPLSVAALKNGEVQVVELFSSDGNVVSNNFVALTDDKHLEGADYIVPVIRKSVDTAAVAAALNSLRPEADDRGDLELNLDVTAQKEQPAAVARRGWHRSGWAEPRRHRCSFLKERPVTGRGGRRCAGKAAGRVPPGTAQYRDGPVPRIPQYRLRWTSRRRR